MNPSIISVLSAMAAAVWSVWTWQSERQKEREIKRHEMTAQYVNNFIVATQELQRKLFKILEEDELSHYRSKQPQPGAPASAVAIELLCSLSAFFGWGLMTFRYGPYTRDARMIAIMAQIGEVLDSRSRFPGDAFRFSLSDRHALGQMVVQRVSETSSGPSFVTITRFKFEERMLDLESEWARLCASDEIRCTLAAIDRAVAGEALEGRERLAVFQNLLLDLITYLEEQEGFRVSFGERGRATVATSPSSLDFPLENNVRILHQMPGRIRLAIPRLHADKNYSARLLSLLQTIDQVKSVRININAACVVVEYAADVGQGDLLQTVVAKIESDSDGSSGNDENWRPIDTASSSPVVLTPATS